MLRSAASCKQAVPSLPGLMKPIRLVDSSPAGCRFGAEHGPFKGWFHKAEGRWCWLPIARRGMDCSRGSGLQLIPSECSCSGTLLVISITLAAVAAGGDWGDCVCLVGWLVGFTCWKAMGQHLTAAISLPSNCLPFKMLCRFSSISALGLSSLTRIARVGRPSTKHTARPMPHLSFGQPYSSKGGNKSRGRVGLGTGLRDSEGARWTCRDSQCWDFWGHGMLCLA